MIEKHIVLEDVDPVLFYGVNNINLHLLKSLYPKLKIVARGNVLRFIGDESEIIRFEQAVLKMENYCSKFNTLEEEVV
ncbi:MAG TPA: phosphate starvation-inducible protein PhoH, partial [Bacteroidales bacterium]|nr:phosphate starvation-inducible protein PhoH [Bacteroidales bacterium]